MRIKRIFAAKVITDPVEALRRMVYGQTALEPCAEALGISHQTLSKQLNEEDGNCPSLRKAAAIEQFMDTDALAECFAARRGGLFIKLPELDSAKLPAELIAGYSRLISAFAEASKDFSVAVEDGKFTAAELDRFQKDLRDVYMSGEQLVRVARARMVEETVT